MSVSALRVADDEVIRRYMSGEPYKSLRRDIDPTRLMALLKSRGVAPRRGHSPWHYLQCTNCARHFVRRACDEKSRISRGQTGPFCSIACAQSWRHKTGRLASIAPLKVLPETIPCLWCENMFHPLRSISRFCNHRCATLYQRRKSQPIQLPKPLSPFEMALAEALG